MQPDIKNDGPGRLRVTAHSHPTIQPDIENHGPPEDGYAAQRFRASMSSRQASRTTATSIARIASFAARFRSRVLPD